MRMPAGRPSVTTTTRRCRPTTLVDLIDRRVAVDGRERRLHRDGDVVVQRIRVLEDLLEGSRSCSEPMRSASESTGSARTTGIWEIP